MSKVGFYKDENVVPLEMHKVGDLCCSQVQLAASCCGCERAQPSLLLPNENQTTMWLHQGDNPAMQCGRTYLHTGTAQAACKQICPASNPCHDDTQHAETWWFKFATVCCILQVRIVQKLTLAPLEQRMACIQGAGYNTFLLQNTDVFLDMLTDSGA
jgi:hypothetical protein